MAWGVGKLEWYYLSLYCFGCLHGIAIGHLAVVAGKWALGSVGIRFSSFPTRAPSSRSAGHFAGPLQGCAYTTLSLAGETYEYVVNGKSAIEWIMERYQVKTDKKSGITNDPNDWAEEVGQPRYILDLLLSIVNLSVQTVEIVEGLPGLEFGEG